MRDLIVTALMNAWPGYTEGITGAQYGWYKHEEAEIQGWFYMFPDVWNWMQEWNTSPRDDQNINHKFPGRSRIWAFLHALPDKALLDAYDYHCCEMYR